MRPELVSAFLRARFPERPLLLPASGHLRLLEEATEAGIVGGAVYDALVAATARHAGATLLSRDRRAMRVYDLLGVSTARDSDMLDSDDDRAADLFDDRLP